MAPKSLSFFHRQQPNLRLHENRASSRRPNTCHYRLQFDAFQCVARAQIMVSMLFSTRGQCVVPVRLWAEMPFYNGRFQFILTQLLIGVGRFNHDGVPPAPLRNSDRNNVHSRYILRLGICRTFLDPTSQSRNPQCLVYRGGESENHDILDEKEGVDFLKYHHGAKFSCM